MTPPDLQQRITEARELLLAREFTQALSEYERLVRHCPRSAVLWAEYGNAAGGLRKLDLADKAWRKALELEPGNAELIGMIGHQYQGARLPERARACFIPARPHCFGTQASLRPLRVPL
jgi:Tfp pilus assembly protein PilF